MNGNTLSRGFESVGFNVGRLMSSVLSLGYKVMGQHAGLVAFNASAARGIRTFRALERPVRHACMVTTSIFAWLNPGSDLATGLLLVTFLPLQSVYFRLNPSWAGDDCDVLLWSRVARAHSRYELATSRCRGSSSSGRRVDANRLSLPGAYVNIQFAAPGSEVHEHPPGACSDAGSRRARMRTRASRSRSRGKFMSSHIATFRSTRTGMRRCAMDALPLARAVG